MPNDKLVNGVDHAKKAAVARCDLNILYGVIALLEGGTISSAHHSDVQRIIAICQCGSQKALERYDRHLAAIRGGQGDG